TTAPPDARVVELVAHDFAFEPRSFTASPGEKIAVQIVNTTTGGTGFTITLPTGRIGLNGAVAGNQSGYFVFTAPSQPGVYGFFGFARFLGQGGGLAGWPGFPPIRHTLPQRDGNYGIGDRAFHSRGARPIGYPVWQWNRPEHWRLVHGPGHRRLVPVLSAGA